MFETIRLLLLLIGAYFLYMGIMKKRIAQKWIGGISILLVIFIFWWMEFWGEKLWFDALGYNDRFWTLFLSKISFATVGAILCAALIALLTFSVPKTNFSLRKVAIAIGALIGGFWGFLNWNVFLKFWYRKAGQILDPIFGKKIGFYLFELPFYNQVQGILETVAFVSIGASFFLLFEINSDQGRLRVRTNQTSKHLRSLFLSSGVLLLTWAFGKYLDRFHLMYSQLGTVSGPGWTDIKVKLPILSILIMATVVLAIILMVPMLRRYLTDFVSRLIPTKGKSPIYPLIGVIVITTTLYFIGLNLIPYAFQEYRVEPNEITFEKPYIEHSIEYTRKAYNLDIVEEKQFVASEEFTEEMVSENPSIFENIRLWDWRALDDVLEQFQEIRLYYEFMDVDVDRYHYNGKYNQVMISAREMKADNLPAESRTFVNKHFKYTHGNGVAMVPVSDFTTEGLPDLLVKNIPPQSKYQSLEVTQPRIYYGEMTDNYVISNSDEEEFDYPSGSQNIYNKYDGSGGILMNNLWRKIIYSYTLGGTQLLLSYYPNDESKIMFRRSVAERVKALAPFLQFEKDPYIVNSQGKLYWIVDAYTTSAYYPYSESISQVENIQYQQGNFQRTTNMLQNSFGRANYIRNSVKVVVDAFNGSVDFYKFDEQDPLIQVWDNILPGMFKNRSQMPKALEEHVRYPVDYLMAQGMVYAKYHMTDPAVFYNQEDLWIPATEKYYNDVIPVQPYYIMWGLPGAEEPEFSLILPFTPKNRQVLIGWVAGLCDRENYGRFLAYNFPKEKRVLGPQQVETKIDQDSFLSGQLSLWDQRGSNVIRGNVLAIPVEETLIYVEPIYLKAETAAYPELRLVCIMHEDNLSYGKTFEEALAGIFDKPDSTLDISQGQIDKSSNEKENQTLIQSANQAFEDYLEATGEGRFEEAAKKLKLLKEYLSRLDTKENNQ